MKIVLVFFALLFSGPSAKAGQVDNLQTVHKFYSAFAAGDAETMAAQYADVEGPVFSDPIFIKLNVGDTRAMWKMLLSSPSKVTVNYQVEAVSDTQAIVHWQADYVLSKTNRPVRNLVTSYLTFEGGKIVRQKDQFDLCAWARMGFGALKGTLICHLPDQTVRKEALAGLKAFKTRQ